MGGLQELGKRVLGDVGQTLGDLKNSVTSSWRWKTMVTMVTIGGDLQPGCLADRLLTGLGQPQINP